MSNLHGDMYAYYLRWREEMGDVYVPLKSDRKMVGELLQLLKKAITMKTGARADSAQVMAGWTALLGAHRGLAEFYRRRKELKHLCTDFNILLNLIKDGQKTTGIRREETDTIRQLIRGGR